MEAFDLEVRGVLAMLARDHIRPAWLTGLEGQVQRISEVMSDYRASAARINGIEDFS